MTDSNKLDLILSEVLNIKSDIRDMDVKIQALDYKVSVLDDKVQALDSNVQEMDERINVIEAHLTKIDTRLAHIEETVGKNYSMTEAFYVTQMEMNTEFKDNISIINKRLDLYHAQFSMMPQQSQSY